MRSKPVSRKRRIVITVAQVDAYLRVHEVKLATARVRRKVAMLLRKAQYIRRMVVDHPKLAQKLHLTTTIDINQQGASK